jgi:tetratricopeptide (TPR) repeat protein
LAALLRAGEALICAALLVGCAVGMTAVVRRAVAWHFFDRAQKVADSEQQEALLRKAISWDAGNPRYPAALARVRQFSFSLADPREIVRLYEQAVALAPHRPDLWMELAAAAEWAGDIARARQAYERARELAPHAPRTNWQLGNFYLRTMEHGSSAPSARGEESFRKALRALREAIFTEPRLRRPAFELAWRVAELRTAQNSPGDDPREMFLRELLPGEPNITIEFLSFLVEKKQMDAAARAWQHLFALPQTFAPSATLFYFDALIHARRATELAAAWQALGQRFPEQFAAAVAGNLLYNADFAQPTLGGGLDWRFPPVEGVRAEIVAAEPLPPSANAAPGSRALLLEFDGAHNPDFSHAYQFVPLAPGQRYHFSVCVKTENLISDSGVRLEVLDAYDAAALFLHTPAVAGTSPWQCSELRFRAGPETSLVVVRVARPHSRKLAGHIAGRARVGGLRLAPAGDAP